MFHSQRNLGLSRRVVAFYLLFCTFGVAWLTIGLVVVAQSIVRSRAESACLSRLGKACAKLEIDYLRHGEANLQALVQRQCSDNTLNYCAIVSGDGHYLAHSSPELRGKLATDPSGEVFRWGDVQGVRYVDEKSRIVREYRVPLKRQGTVFGSLRMAVEEPSYWQMFLATAELAPFAVLAPLGLVSLGAFVLRRLVKPVADVETQLRGVAVAPSLADVPFHQVKARTAGALGWNRVVDQLHRLEQEPPLDQRLAEVLEHRRQANADDILHSLSDGIAVTNGEGTITFANHCLLALLGIDADADTLRDKQMAQLIGSEGDQHEVLDPATANRTVVSEIKRAHAGGQRILRLARHPLRSSTGAATAGHVWSVRDITQQKLAERMRDQFLDSATHELRTPLANIKGYAETLALSEMLDVERQKEFCNTINAEASRLARFIDDLLSISSMEVGSLSLDRQNVETERLLNETIEKVRPLMEQKEIIFQTVLPEKLPELNLDKEKLVATLVNLLGNAVKYTPKGGHVALKVKIDDQILQIDVEDSGVGIAKDELPRIFDKFFRSADPRVQQQTGTGLGLSLVREVVRLHGGELAVQSELNKGSTFTITLPRN